MQARGQARPPLGIIYDSALGGRVDEALALALLYGLDGKNEARISALTLTRSNLKAAALCEVIGRFYAGAVSGAFNAMGRTLPVGLADDGRLSEDTPMLTKPLAKKGADGQPVYAHGIDSLTDTADPVVVIRNALTAQYDQNAAIVMTGPATTLARLLGLPGAKPIIAAKVRYLVVAAGAFPDGPAEFNVRSDIAAARRLFAEWPTPIVACGAELDGQVLFPADSIQKDFAWSPNHPVVDAYMAFKPMPYDASTWAMTAVLQAVRPGENYFKLSEPGRITVTEDGRTKFTPSSDGQHRYLRIEADQKDRILKTYVEMASAKPVVRQRFRPPQQQQVDPVKPPNTPPVKPPPQ